MAANISRIKFYGVNDMTTGLHLAAAETKLSQLDLSQSITDINDALELYNIIEMFKTGVRLNHWSDETYAELKKRSLSIMGNLGRFFSTITDENILNELSGIDFNYHEDFWVLFSFFSLNKRISRDAISEILLQNARCLHSLLMHKDIVDTYSDLVTESLMSSSSNAEILISEYLSFHEHKISTPFFLPKELTFEKRESLINMYLSSNDANPNYVKLVYDSRDNINLPLSLKTKHNAQKQYDTLVQKMFPVESNLGLKLSFEVSYDPEYEDAIKPPKTPGAYDSVVFGLKWIENNLEPSTLLNNFIYMFGFVDRFFRCQFVSNPVRQSLIERLVGIRGSQSYFMGSNERFVNQSFSLMLLSYQHILELHNIHIESLIQWFFETYLPEEFKVKGFIFNPPSNGVTDLEKCKLLATEIDSVLKQFDFFVREGEIIREIFENNSESMQFRNLSSMISNKYIYSSSVECDNCMACLFSDQNTLSFTEKHGTKYHTFYELLRMENITKEDILPGNAPLVDFLIYKKCIEFDESLHIKLCNERVFLLHDLYKNQYCCSSYIPFLEPTIRALLASGDIRYASSLLSEPEQEYISYMLTKSDYSNGQDLRNKYIHGNYPSDIAQHGKDYLEFLKILILIVININEEFCLREDLANIQTNQFES